MKNKKKRDAQAETEKAMLLDPEKLKEKKKRRRKKIAVTVLCELAMIVIIICVAFQIVKAIGKSSLQSHAESAGPSLEPIMTTEALTKEEESRWQEGWVKYNGKIYTYNEDIMTFLFMGIDKNSDVKEVAEGTNGGQADALFLAVMNPHDKTVSVIGINRNTMADIDIYNEDGAYVNTVKAQIAVQHGFGNGIEESCEYQVKAVQKLFYNLPIHGYAAINMSAIPAINDAVGGVDVIVLEDLSQKDASLVKGNTVHLMGESAYIYVRERDVKEFASADMRLERQKQYLSAFIGEAGKAAKKDLTIVIDLYKEISSQMITDISIDEAVYLASVVTDYKFEKDNFHMTAGETVMGDRFEEFEIDEEALYKLILEVFYEEVEE